MPLTISDKLGPYEILAPNHMIFLENFFDELRRRVPAPR
jgi:hypothetical protein